MKSIIIWDGKDLSALSIKPCMFKPGEQDSWKISNEEVSFIAIHSTCDKQSEEIILDVSDVLNQHVDSNIALGQLASDITFEAIMLTRNGKACFWVREQVPDGFRNILAFIDDGVYTCFGDYAEYARKKIGTMSMGKLIIDLFTNCFQKDDQSLVTLQFPTIGEPCMIGQDTANVWSFNKRVK